MDSDDCNHLPDRVMKIECALPIRTYDIDFVGMEMGGLRCILAAEIVSGEPESPRLAAQAQQTVIFIDLSTRRPVRIPADFLAEA